MTDSFNYTVLCIWLYLYAGGIMLPLLTLCILGVVEPELRPRASALANVAYNGFGYMPATFIYGIACDYTGGKTSKWGMIITMVMNFPIALAIFSAIYYKPNVETFLDERKEQIAENYINKNEDTTIKDINDRFNSVDQSYSRINTYKYGSRFVGNIGLTDSLLPGYTANSRSGS